MAKIEDLGQIDDAEAVTSIQPLLFRAARSSLWAAPEHGLDPFDMLLPKLMLMPIDPDSDMHTSTGCDAIDLRSRIASSLLPNLLVSATFASPAYFAF